MNELCPSEQEIVGRDAARRQVSRVAVTKCVVGDVPPDYDSAVFLCTGRRPSNPAIRWRVCRLPAVVARVGGHVQGRRPTVGPSTNLIQARSHTRGPGGSRTGNGTSGFSFTMRLHTLCPIASARAITSSSSNVRMRLSRIIQSPSTMTSLMSAPCA